MPYILCLLLQYFIKLWKSILSTCYSIVSERDCHSVFNLNIFFFLIKHFTCSSQKLSKLLRQVSLPILSPFFRLKKRYHWSSFSYNISIFLKFLKFLKSSQIRIHDSYHIFLFLIYYSTVFSTSVTLYYLQIIMVTNHIRNDFKHSVAQIFTTFLFSSRFLDNSGFLKNINLLVIICLIFSFLRLWQKKKKKTGHIIQVDTPISFYTILTEK